jgi:hypothetical protein
LSNAYFKFNDKFFRQKTGLPIGSAIGGPIACLALALEEDRLLNRLKISDRELAAIFEHYRRYLDDSLLMFGAKSPQEANRLADKLWKELKAMRNAFDFTTTHATKELIVLDIFVQLTESGLRLKNYQKPTDKRTLLNTESCHPEHVKKSIAYSVALRMRRLCNNEDDFIQALVDQAWALLGRGHDVDWIVDGFARAVVKPLKKPCKEPRKTTKRTLFDWSRRTTTRLTSEKAFAEFRKKKKSWQTLLEALI